MVSGDGEQRQKDNGTIIKLNIVDSGWSFGQCKSNCIKICIRLYLFYKKQGHRHEVFIGGGGRIHRHPNPPTPTIWFLLGFRPLYFQYVVKCKKMYPIQEKEYGDIANNAIRYCKYPNFWGSFPWFLKVRGSCPDPRDHQPRRRRPSKRIKKKWEQESVIVKTLAFPE